MSSLEDVFLDSIKWGECSDLSHSCACVKKFDEGVKKYPTFKFFSSRGIMYLKHKENFELAIVQFTNSIKMKPDVDSFLYRSVAYTQLGKHRKAISDANKAVEISKDNPEVYLVLGEAHAKSDNFVEAIKDWAIAEELIEKKLSSSVDENKENVDDRKSRSLLLRLFRKVSSLYLHYGKHEKAMEYGNRILKMRKRMKVLDPQDKENVCRAFIIISRIYFHRKQFRKSIEYVKQSIQFHPDCPSIIGKYISLAASHDSLEEYEISFSYYEKVTQCQMFNPVGLGEALYRKTLSLMKLNNFKKALDDASLSMNAIRGFYERPLVEVSQFRKEQIALELARQLVLRGKCYAMLHMWKKSEKEFSLAISKILPLYKRVEEIDEEERGEFDNPLYHILRFQASYYHLYRGIVRNEMKMYNEVMVDYNISKNLWPNHRALINLCITGIARMRDKRDTNGKKAVVSPTDPIWKQIENLEGMKEILERIKPLLIEKMCKENCRRGFMIQIFHGLDEEGEITFEECQFVELERSCRRCENEEKCKKMKRCSGCLMVFYCSTKCQRRDWKSHKKDCMMLDKRNFVWKKTKEKL